MGSAKGIAKDVLTDTAIGAVGGGLFGSAVAGEGNRGEGALFGALAGGAVSAPLSAAMLGAGKASTKQQLIVDRANTEMLHQFRAPMGKYNGDRGEKLRLIRDKAQRRSNFLGNVNDITPIVTLPATMAAGTAAGMHVRDNTSDT